MTKNYLESLDNNPSTYGNSLPGKIADLDRSGEMPMSIDNLPRAACKDLRLRKSLTAGEVIKPGRVLILIDGALYCGSPKRGPVVGVSLHRNRGDAMNVGEPQTILRGGTVVIDGHVGADGPVYVAEDGRFVLAGTPDAVLVPKMSARSGVVEVDL